MLSGVVDMKSKSTQITKEEARKFIELAIKAQAKNGKPNLIRIK